MTDQNSQSVSHQQVVVNVQHLQQEAQPPPFNEIHEGPKCSLFKLIRFFGGRDSIIVMCNLLIVLTLCSIFQLLLGNQTSQL